jgi:outer membrane lipoprotein-sorting protein
MTRLSEAFGDNLSPTTASTLSPISRKRGLSPFFVALLLVATLCAGAAGAQALVESPSSEVERIDALLDQSFYAIAGVYDYQGTLLKRELFGDEIVEQKIAFKFSRPFKVYAKYIEPHEGREGIYVRGSNKNRLRAHRGSVPDVAVSLSPLGRVAMLDNHHPITSFGLERMLEIGAQNIRKAIERGDARLRLSDGGVVHGEPTWRIDIESQSGGRYVTVKRYEDLWELATRVGQDMYVILHHNDGIDSPTDVTPGQKVFVPHYYASRGQYFIGKRTFVMIKAKSWDHKGKLYESYEYPELELNPGLSNRDFDHRNKDYDFMIINQR